MGSKRQLNALLRKSLAIQRKSWCYSCVLVCMPIFVSILLGVLQVRVARAAPFLPRI